MKWKHRYLFWTCVATVTLAIVAIHSEFLRDNRPSVVVNVTGRRVISQRPTKRPFDWVEHDPFAAKRASFAEDNPW
jgi:hypothetical protein